MQGFSGPALSAASGKRATSFDALDMRKTRHMRQSLPVARIGQFTRARSTECPEFRTRKNA